MSVLSLVYCGRTRGDKHLWRVTLGGRSGKQFPRMGKLFLNWVTEDVVLGDVR